jgi:hypothetical protein
MKKNNWVLLLFLLIGLLTGSLLSQALQDVQALSFLTKSTSIAWEPSADLDVIQYDFKIRFKLSLLSVAGLIAAFWLYRRL